MNEVQIPDTECIACREGITNPICPECMAREISSWKPALKTMLVTPETDEMDFSGVRCLKCGKKVSICAHCYATDVYDIIGEDYPEFAEEFSMRFGLNEKFF